MPANTDKSHLYLNLQSQTQPMSPAGCTITTNIEYCDSSYCLYGPEA